jgi:hypothetical protein
MIKIPVPFWRFAMTFGIPTGERVAMINSGFTFAEPMYMALQLDTFQREQRYYPESHLVA